MGAAYVCCNKYSCPIIRTNHKRSLEKKTFYNLLNAEISKYKSKMTKFGDNFYMQRKIW